ncbi:MAG: hypothetical protein JW783_14245 [Bacteroidales bacterium]|nr:hypothetical protein [Bacteroidales bacterium]MBN2749714.1 hypothetical protein [Bacteroidales bacterium]
MTREERLVFCKICANRKLDMSDGLICSLTNKVADFDNNCPDYDSDERAAKQELEKKKEKDIAEKGRRKTLNVFYVLIGLSIFVIIFSHLTFKPVNAREIAQELIRIGLEIGLYYAIFLGKNWARTLMTILYILGIILGFFSMIALLGKSPVGLILLIMILVYGFAVYFFNADKDFKTFFEYQKKNA